MKYLGINLKQNEQNLYEEKYKTWMKKYQRTK